MSRELGVALVSFLAPVALWAAYPGRPKAAALGALISIGVGVAWLALAPGMDGVLSSSAAALACFLGWQAGAARTARRQALAEEIAEMRRRRDAAAEALAGSKTKVKETDREQKETLALYGMIKSLAEALSWEDARPRLEAAATQYMGVTDFAFYASQGSSFRLVTARRLDGSPGANWTMLERFLQERGVTPAQACRIESPESAAIVPILDNGELLGVFYARAPKGADSAAVFGKAQSFVQEMAFAFRRVKLFQEVEGLSRIDGLTGVHRRGDFDDRLQQELVRAKTFKTTLGLMLLDIDHFKQLNDRYGHPFGDQVLRRVGEILNAAVYETDFVARYGGEEFVVLLPRAEPEGARRKAEAIRRAIEAEKFPLGFEMVRATASIGIAHFPRDAATPEELVAKADAAMYEAKSHGRNQVRA